jgi:hypothetical protein
MPWKTTMGCRLVRSRQLPDARHVPRRPRQAAEITTTSAPHTPGNTGLVAAAVLRRPGTAPTSSTCSVSPVQAVHENHCGAILPCTRGAQSRTSWPVRGRCSGQARQTAPASLWFGEAADVWDDNLPRSMRKAEPVYRHSSPAVAARRRGRGRRPVRVQKMHGRIARQAAASQ